MISHKCIIQHFSHYKKLYGDKKKAIREIRKYIRCYTEPSESKKRNRNNPLFSLYCEIVRKDLGFRGVTLRYLVELMLYGNPDEFYVWSGWDIPVFPDVEFPKERIPQVESYLLYNSRPPKTNTEKWMHYTHWLVHCAFRGWGRYYPISI